VDRLWRYRPWLVAVVATAILTTLATGGDDPVASTASTGAGVAPSAVGADLPGVEVPGASSGTGAVGGEGAAASGTTLPGTTAGGGAAATAAGPSTGPGFGTPEALGAPDCDAKAGKIRISFIWRPRCVRPWPAGADNGGATYQGVTATTIRVVRYNDPIQPITDAELKRRWQTSIDVYERFYRMWGRKIENIVVGKSGDDEVAQRADAVKIATLKPFLVIGVPSTDRILITELATRKIIVVTGSTVPLSLTNGLAPYVWGSTIQPDELVAMNIAEYAGRRLLKRPAKWAGQPDLRLKERKFGVILPETLDQRYFKEAFGRHGGQAVMQTYSGAQEDAASWGERAQVIAARLRSEGVTTVVAITDLLFTGPMTHAAASQNWFPEWVTTGYLAQDLDIAAATFNQAEWRNAFGVAGIPVASGKRAPWPQYWFYDWYWGPDHSTDNMNGPAHSEATVLFSGIHGAGPRLDPTTFRDGVFALAPTGGASTGSVIAAQHSFGRHGFFPWDDYNAFDDFDEVFWDPTAVAPDLVTGQNTPGHYRHLNGGKRYTIDQWPSSEPAMFDPAGTAMYYDAYPPNDRPPDYPCTGCPSTTRR
jgi:hypothetical protein